MIRKLFLLVLMVILPASAALLYLDMYKNLVLIFIIAAFILNVIILLLSRKDGSSRVETLTEAPAAGEPDTLSEETGEKQGLEEELEKERKEKDYWRDISSRVYNSFLAYEATLPVIEKLSKLVTNKSERSTIDLTNNIFSIAEVSSDVSGKIHTLLEEMTSGDRSLESNISRLESEMDNLSGMEEAFVEILTGYRNEIKSLSTTITGIKDFTESLTDLSERTHILAINASVEAARVGARGAGFAVIAGEVQKLAASAKEIAASIHELTGRIDNQVNSSFKVQGEQIDHAVRGIQQSKGDVGDMVQVFAPQAKMISESISESKRLSENVTENLNKITVSLQFQDYIRQVIEHILGILNDQKNSHRENFPVDNLDRAKKSTILEEEVLNAVTRYFTIRDEWEIVGLEFEESEADEHRDTSAETDFGGDVSLF